MTLPQWMMMIFAWILTYIDEGPLLVRIDCLQSKPDATTQTLQKDQLVKNIGVTSQIIAEARAHRVSLLKWDGSCKGHRTSCIHIVSTTLLYTMNDNHLLSTGMAVFIYAS